MAKDNVPDLAVDLGLSVLWRIKISGISSKENTIVGEYDMNGSAKVRITLFLKTLQAISVLIRSLI